MRSITKTEAGLCDICGMDTTAKLGDSPLCCTHIAEALGDMQLHDEHACYKVVRVHPEKGTRHSAMLWFDHSWSIQYGYRETVHGRSATGLAVMPSLRQAVSFLICNAMGAFTFELWSAIYDFRIRGKRSIAASSIDPDDMRMFWNGPREYKYAMDMQGGIWVHGVKLMNPIVQIPREVV